MRAQEASVLLPSGLLTEVHSSLHTPASSWPTGPQLTVLCNPKPPVPPVWSCLPSRPGHGG